MLPREVRRSFSEEGYFHFKFAVTALKFPDPLVIRHAFRDRLTGELFLIRLHPEAQGGIVHAEFSRHLCDRKRVFDHSSGGLFLELRSIGLALWHLIPFLSRSESYWIPVRKVWGTSVPGSTRRECTFLLGLLRNSYSARCVGGVWRRIRGRQPRLGVIAPGGTAPKSPWFLACEFVLAEAG